MPAAVRSGAHCWRRRGLPPKRVKVLRDAFQAMVADPEFVAELQRTNVELAPLPGEQVAEFVARTLNVPAAVRERAKLAFGALARISLVAHVLFGKPVPTFPEHALAEKPRLNPGAFS
jgi:hypothetical protein